MNRAPTVAFGEYTGRIPARDEKGSSWVRERYIGERARRSSGSASCACPSSRMVRSDIEQTKDMVDRFMDAGLTYFDTAYVLRQRRLGARAEGGARRPLSPARRSPSPPRSTLTSRHRRRCAPSARGELGAHGRGVLRLLPAPRDSAFGMWRSTMSTAYGTS